MSPFSIIIPSKNVSNLTQCIGAIRLRGETARIIIVDDGLLDDERLVTIENSPLADLQPPVTMIPGVKPFVFARNVNLGIKAAGTDDVVIMNDDALLETELGLSRLAHDAAHNPEYGVIAASVDSCGTPNQMHCSVKTGLRVEKVMLAFICVFIPRRILDELGLLDDRFAVNAGGDGRRGYGCEDDDFSWRVREAGYLLGVENDVFVTHTQLPSTFRSDREHPADVKIHEALFEKKWGRHPRCPK